MIYLWRIIIIDSNCFHSYANLISKWESEHFGARFFPIVTNYFKSIEYYNLFQKNKALRICCPLYLDTVDHRNWMRPKYWVRTQYYIAGIPGSPAAFYHFLKDAVGASHVTIKSVKELGLQETGLPASLACSFLQVWKKEWNGLQETGLLARYCMATRQSAGER